MHIVKYTNGGQFCLYAWGSVSGEAVFEHCPEDVLPAIKECARAVRGFVDDLLKAANWIASIAMIVALLVAVLVCLDGLGGHRAFLQRGRMAHG